MMTPPVYRTWIAQPHQAITSYVDDYTGEWRHRLHGRHYGHDELEMGTAVVKAWHEENAGRDWYREEHVTRRAVEATIGSGFVDFLLRC